MNELYKTSIIDFAAFLLAKGAIFMGLTFDRPRHGVLLFQDRDLCEQLHTEYLNNGEVSARELLIRKKELSDMIAIKLTEERESHYNH